MRGADKLPAKPSYAKARADTNRRALIYLARAFIDEPRPVLVSSAEHARLQARSFLAALHKLYNDEGPVGLRSRHSAEGEIMRDEIEMLLEEFDDAER